MQQLEWCKRILKLPNFAEVKIKGYGYVGSAELIVVALLLSLTLSFLLRTINPNYLIIGVILPLLLARNGVAISNYWEAFALLLLLRRFTNTLAFLDILIIVCLWNPNIALGKRVADCLSAKSCK